MYRILIQEIDNNGKAVTLHDEKHKNIMMLAESDENNMVTEVLMNINLSRAASTIAQSKSFFEAAKLAVFGKLIMDEQKNKEVEGEVQ